MFILSHWTTFLHTIGVYQSRIPLYKLNMYIIVLFCSWWKSSWTQFLLMIVRIVPNTKRTDVMCRKAFYKTTQRMSTMIVCWNTKTSTSDICTTWGKKKFLPSQVLWDLSKEAPEHFHSHFFLHHLLHKEEPNKLMLSVIAVQMVHKQVPSTLLWLCVFFATFQEDWGY